MNIKFVMLKTICLLLIFSIASNFAKSQQLPDSFLSYVQNIQTAQLGNQNAEVVINQLDDNTLHIKYIFNLFEDVQQDDWQVNVILAFQPSFHWAPHLTPTDKHIIDQHVFRSPAMIVYDNNPLHFHFLLYFLY